MSVAVNPFASALKVIENFIEAAKPTAKAINELASTVNKKAMAYIEETGPEFIQGRRGGKTHRVALCGPGPKIPKFIGPLQPGCSNILQPVINCGHDFKPIVEKILLTPDSQGKIHSVDITGMTPGQMEQLIKMYASMRDEVSELTAENVDYLKERLNKKRFGL